MTWQTDISTISRERQRIQQPRLLIKSAGPAGERVKLLNPGHSLHPQTSIRVSDFHEIRRSHGYANWNGLTKDIDVSRLRY